MGISTTNLTSTGELIPDFERTINSMFYIAIQPTTPPQKLPNDPQKIRLFLIAGLFFRETL